MCFRKKHPLEGLDLVHHVAHRMISQLAEHANTLRRICRAQGQLTGDCDYFALLIEEATHLHFFEDVFRMRDVIVSRLHEVLMPSQRFCTREVLVNRWRELRARPSHEASHISQYPRR